MPAPSIHDVLVAHADPIAHGGRVAHAPCLFHQDPAGAEQILVPVSHNVPAAHTAPVVNAPAVVCQVPTSVKVPVLPLHHAPTQVKYTINNDVVQGQIGISRFPKGKCCLGDLCKHELLELRPAHKCPGCNKIIHPLCGVYDENYEDSYFCPPCDMNKKM